MDDKKYYTICNAVFIAITIVSVALAIISWFVLPDQVVSTLGEKAGAETMSKLEAIGIPFLITGVGILIYVAKKDFRAILVSALGIAGYLINFFCNL